MKINKMVKDWMLYVSFFASLISIIVPFLMFIWFLIYIAVNEKAPSCAISMNLNHLLFFVFMWAAAFFIGVSSEMELSRRHPERFDYEI